MASASTSERKNEISFQTLKLDDTLIEYMTVGAGEPILFTHGGLLSDIAVPLADQPALSGYRLIGYRRRGYATSDLTTAPEGTTIADMAVDAAALLDHLGVSRAHIVGHSLGGIVSLQFALDFPERVITLSLLEPPFASRETLTDSIPAVVSLPLSYYQDGDPDRAVDLSLQAAGVENWREITAATVPNGVDLALAHAETFYERDGIAIMSFEFGPAEAENVLVPVLSMIGAETKGAIYQEGRSMFHDWWGDNVEDSDIAGSNHLLPIHQPAAVASALANFLSRHPEPSTT